MSRHSRRQPVRRDLEASQAGFHSEDHPRPLAEEAFDESFDDFETDALVIPEDELVETLGEEHEKEHTGEDDQIDDPVRIYLMQMGEIPMLSRQEETAVAKRIDRSRRGFRYSMLATDYILHAAIGLLESIRDNRLRLDRTIEVSVVNLREKARLLKVLTPNLRTLHHLMLQNKRDFALAINRRQPRKHRRLAWRRLLNRRVKAVRLVEEMGLRTQRLQPLPAKTPADFPADGRDSPATGGRPAATRRTFSARPSFARNSAT